MRDMLNMRVATDENHTERNNEVQAKQKVGNRLQAAIIRNIHHERKLKLECEALQKAKKTVENDIRQIEQKLHRTQRHHAGQDLHGKHSIASQFNGKKVIIDRSPYISKADQHLPKVKTVPGSLLRNAEGDNQWLSKSKEDTDTVPAYGKRFLHMLESSYADSTARTHKIESHKRGILARSFSKEQNNTFNSNDGEEMAFSSSDEWYNGNEEAAADRLVLVSDDRLAHEVAGYSRYLVKMDHIAKRRGSGTDDMEKGINDSIVHKNMSRLDSSEKNNNKSQAIKYQDHYDMKSNGKQKFRGSEVRRGSQPNFCTDASVGEHGTNAKDLESFDEKLGYDSFARGRTSSKSDGDLKRLALDGVSADSVEEYWQKISKPTITKEGEMYDQTGCFITTLQKKENIL